MSTVTIHQQPGTERSALDERPWDPGFTSRKPEMPIYPTHDGSVEVPVFCEPTTLQKDDVPWLDVVSGGAWDEHRIAMAENSIDRGSKKLHRHLSAEARETIVADRTSFYAEFLGWGDTNHPLHDVYNRMFSHKSGFDGLIRPVVFINAARTLHAHGVDLTRALQSHWEIAWLDSRHIEQKMRWLQKALHFSGSKLSAAEVVSYKANAIGLQTGRLLVAAAFTSILPQDFDMTDRPETVAQLLYFPPESLVQHALSTHMGLAAGTEADTRGKRRSKTNHVLSEQTVRLFADLAAVSRESSAAAKGAERSVNEFRQERTLELLAGAFRQVYAMKDPECRESSLRPLRRIGRAYLRLHDIDPHVFEHAAL